MTTQEDFVAFPNATATVTLSELVESDEKFPVKLSSKVCVGSRLPDVVFDGGENAGKTLLVVSGAGTSHNCVTARVSAALCASFRTLQHNPTACDDGTDEPLEVFWKEMLIVLYDEENSTDNNSVMALDSPLPEEFDDD